MYKHIKRTFLFAVTWIMKTIDSRSESKNDNVLCPLSFPWHFPMVSKQGIYFRVKDMVIG